MPWYNGDYPGSYKNQPVELRSKAVEIAKRGGSGKNDKKSLYE